MGIYWYGPGDRREQATSGSNPTFYRADRKTMIFVHGWMGNAGGASTWCYRTTTRCNPDVCGDERLLVDSWLDDGWNVGMFYWDQLADEKCIHDAERKIWSDLYTDSPQAQASAGCLNWTSSSEGVRSSRPLCSEGPSVAHMCASAVAEAMGDYAGPQVHLVGHSLGSGLTVRCAWLLHEMGHRAKPSRVALADPDFPVPKSLLGKEMFMDHSGRTTVGAACPRDESFRQGGVLSEDAIAETARLVLELRRRGVPTLVALTSIMPRTRPMSVPIWALEHEAVLVRYNSSLCGRRYSGILRRLECEHNAAVPIVLLANRLFLPNASGASQADILQYLSRQQQHIEQGYQPYWQQELGGDTFAGDDDTFAFKLARLHG